MIGEGLCQILSIKEVIKYCLCGITIMGGASEVKET
jgi:hypothetical protein